MESYFHLINLFPLCFCLFVTLLKEMGKILTLRRCWKWLSAPFILLEQHRGKENSGGGSFVLAALLYT
mgnify:CR=1 FL=1